MHKNFGTIVAILAIIFIGAIVVIVYQGESSYPSTADMLQPVTQLTSSSSPTQFTSNTDEGNDATSTPGHGSRPVVKGNTLTKQNVFDAVNAARFDGEHSVLKESAELDAAAAAKLHDMEVNHYFAHTSPAGATPWSWIIGAGYNYLGSGENLADNFDSTSETVAAWLASPTHRTNIMKDLYTETGVAVDTIDVYTTTAEDGTIVSHRNVVVQIFAAPARH